MEVTEDVSHSTISGIGKYTGEIWGVYMEVPRPNIGRLYGSHKVDQKKKALKSLAQWKPMG